MFTENFFVLSESINFHNSSFKVNKAEFYENPYTVDP